MRTLILKSTNTIGANMNCPIWKTSAQILENAGDYQVVDSPRAGGKYWISGTAIAQVGSLTDNAKRLLTTWICEQRQAGLEAPKVQSNIVALIKSRQVLPVMSRMVAALKYLAVHITQLGDRLNFGDDQDLHTMRLLAETESKNAGEVFEIFQMLENTGLVNGSFFIGGGGAVRPTVRGWQELDNLRKPRIDSSQAFVAMWFNDQTTDAYVKGIEPAIGMAGYKSVRIDKKEHNNKIDDEIISEIRRSRFLIADFTCEPKNVRGGVYYEAGFAMGLGIPVIWTCKDTSLNDLHFDTRQYSHIIWQAPADLFEQLKNRIGATIGDGPLSKTY
jgi:nucleoside 2-deoxyribosyltransferase